MASVNNVNSNFRKIALTDANDRVTGITLSGASSLKVAGGTSGQALLSDGAGGFTWGTPSAAPMTWVTSIPTYATDGAAATRGSVSKELIMYRQVSGKLYNFFWQVFYGGGGVAGTGDYLIDLPGGLQFDTTLPYQETFSQSSGGGNNPGFGKAILPNSSGYLGTTNNINTVGVVPYNSTRFRVFVGTGTGARCWASNLYGFGGGPIVASVFFEAVIA